MNDEYTTSNVEYIAVMPHAWGCGHDPLAAVLNAGRNLPSGQPATLNIIRVPQGAWDVSAIDGTVSWDQSVYTGDEQLGEFEYDATDMVARAIGRALGIASNLLRGVSYTSDDRLRDFTALADRASDLDCDCDELLADIV